MGANGFPFPAKMKKKNFKKSEFIFAHFFPETLCGPLPIANGERRHKRLFVYIYLEKSEKKRKKKNLEGIRFCGFYLQFRQPE